MAQGHTTQGEQIVSSTIIPNRLSKMFCEGYGYIAGLANTDSAFADDPQDWMTYYATVAEDGLRHGDQDQVNFSAGQMLALEWLSSES